MQFKTGPARVGGCGLGGFRGIIKVIEMHFNLITALRSPRIPTSEWDDGVMPSPDWGQKHTQTKQKVGQNEKMLSWLFSLLTRSAVHCHIEIPTLRNRKPGDKTKYISISKLISLFPELLLLTRVKRNREFISKECLNTRVLNHVLKFPFSAKSNDDKWRMACVHNKEFWANNIFCEFLTGSHPAPPSMTWTKFHPRPSLAAGDFANHFLTPALY